MGTAVRAGKRGHPIRGRGNVDGGGRKGERIQRGEGSGNKMVKGGKKQEQRAGAKKREEKEGRRRLPKRENKAKW